MLISLSRMELADCGSPEKLILEILKQLPDLTPPVPVKQIAIAAGIEEVKGLETEAFEGALIALADKSRGVILVNRARPKVRRRFSVGHELGHFLIPTHVAMDAKGFQCRASDMRISAAPSADRADRMEVEANRFAAHLLMPPPMVRKDLSKLRGVDIGHILDLAGRYDVSKEAAARRYVEYTDDVCAVVLSRDGSVMRSYRDRTFPYIPLSSNDRVPAQSMTARYTGDGLSSLEEVETSTWFDDERKLRNASLYEQVLVQAKGFRLTLLSLDLQDEEDEELDDHIEASWRPKFRK